MKKPVFNHCNTIYTIAWILTIPLLINICTACNLFPLWLSWAIYFIVLILSAVRLVHGFRQHCYKFAWGLIAQLILGALILTFFQLSVNKVIKTPVSNPVTPTELKIKTPALVDSINNAENESIKAAKKSPAKHVSTKKAN